MTVEKLKQMAKLLLEVTNWHSNPKSYEYNECEIEPCHFCSTVALLVHGSEPNLRSVPRSDGGKEPS